MNNEKEEARASLKQSLRRGATVYTVIRSVSKSGMSRTLDVYTIKKNQPHRLTWWVARALGWTYDKKREALRVGGCGMDMGFHTVNCLSYALHGTKCKRAGYTLEHRWL